MLKSVGIGYGRRPGLSPLQDRDKKKQEQVLITCTENEMTNPVNGADEYRTPLPCEARTYELFKIVPDSILISAVLHRSVTFQPSIESQSMASKNGLVSEVLSRWQFAGFSQVRWCRLTHRALIAVHLFT
jgi:hypothetical protein